MHHRIHFWRIGRQHADTLRAVFAQIARGANRILHGGIGEVEVVNQVRGFVARGRAASVEKIGDEYAKALRSEPVGRGFDAIVDAPPFFKHDDPRRVGLRRGCEIPGPGLAVGSGELDHRSH